MVMRELRFRLKEWQANLHDANTLPFSRSCGACNSNTADPVNQTMIQIY